MLPYNQYTPEDSYYIKNHLAQHECFDNKKSTFMVIYIARTIMRRLHLPSAQANLLFLLTVPKIP